jgi:gas vesicle protein
MNQATSNKTLFAVLAGVVIGLLFAPKEGKKLRAEVNEKLDDAKDNTLKATDKAKLKWYEMRNKAESEVEEAVDEARTEQKRLANK